MISFLPLSNAIKSMVVAGQAAIQPYWVKNDSADMGVWSRHVVGALHLIDFAWC